MGGRRINVVLFAPEEVILRENGDVLTGTLSEISQIKKTPGRYKTGVYFRPDMTSGEVRSVLEENFPLLQNRRYGTIKDDLCWRRCSQLFFISP